MQHHTDRENEYWDGFYLQKSLISTPSQFAAFILNELPDQETFLDFGCGNGRDTFFFSKYKKNAFGLDRSKEAVEINRKIAETERLKCSFLTANINPGSDVRELKAMFEGKEKCVFYARFFLHALQDDEIIFFLKFIQSLKTSNSYLAFEYRTTEDKDLPKTQATHFRNFLDPNFVKKNCEEITSQLIYESTGTGLAKYKEDDAVVCRQIFKI